MSSEKFREEVIELVRKYKRDEELGIPADVIGHWMADHVVTLQFLKEDLLAYEVRS